MESLGTGHPDVGRAIPRDGRAEVHEWNEDPGADLLYDDTPLCDPFDRPEGDDR